MKIAMIGHKRVPSCEGGIEVVVEELAVRMVQQGHEVTLYNRWQKQYGKSPREYKGIVLRDVPTLGVKGSDAVVYSFFATVLALFGHYDVIHFHAEGPALMSWLTKLFRIPTVVTVHGLDWQRGKWEYCASSYIKFAEKVAVRFADEIIVLSGNVKDYFQKSYGRKVHFIRNGVTGGEYKQVSEIRKLGLEGNDYILFLARLVPEKGIHYLLEAFRRTDTNLKLVIAGRLDSSEYVEKIKQMAAEDNRVLLSGFVEGRLRDELYSNCRLYVLPSDVEGMPMSLLEALSFGVPCLASDIEENKVAPEEYLSLFRRSEIDALKEKMEQVLTDTYAPKKRDEQIRWMREHYSWDPVVSNTLSLYKDAAKKKHRFFSFRKRKRM